MRSFACRAASVWAAFAALVLTSCAEPAYRLDSCEITCDSECPTGFECRWGYCVAPGFEKACTQPLLLRAPKAIDHFVCEPLQLSIASEGGRGPYHYSVTAAAGKPLPSYFEVDDDSAGLSVFAPADSLNPSTPLSLEVEVSDEQGERTAQTIDVYLRRCTQVIAPDLSGLCVGNEVSVALDAEGGFENYAWSVDGQLPQDLKLEDGSLVGTLTEDSVGRYEVELQVHDRDQAGEDDTDTEVKVLDSSVAVVIDVRDCLRIEPPAGDLALCTGDAASIEFTAKGGSPPYQWAADDLPSGLSLDADSGVLSGTTDARGAHAIDVSVRDAEGEEVTEHLLPVAVNACPIIRTDRISACVGTEVSISLQAEPADEGLQWRKLSGPEELTVEPNGRLRWLPMKPLSAKLGLSVESAEGERVGEIPVEALAAKSGQCNPLELVTTELPDACAGQFYSFELEARGGVGGYLWSEHGTTGSWPAFLELDPDTGELSGTAPLDAAGSYSLRVGITSGQLVSTELPLRVRPSCKYAFIGREDSRDGLFVADVRQRSMPELEPEEVLSDSELQIVDFDFSAAGDQLGFVARPREASSGTPDSFVVVPVTDIEGRPAPAHFPEADLDLDLERIEQFAWDHDTARVAITFTTAAHEQRLVVLDAVNDLVATTPVAILNSGLGDVFWLGDAACYLGLVDPPTDDEGVFDHVGVTCHELDDNFELGDAATRFPVDQTLFSPPERLQFVSRPHTFAMYLPTSPNEPYETYVSFDWDPFQLGLYESVPDPTLSWTARRGDPFYSEAETDLVRFPLAPDVDSQGEALGPDWILPDCEQLLAWSADGSALACSSAGQLQLATFDAEGQLVDARAVADAHDLEGQDYSRAFSADSKWFVYDTPDLEVFAVDLSAGTWRSESVMNTELGGFSALLSSAGGVVLHTGDGLFLLRPDEQPVALSAGMDLDPALPCGHDGAVSGPDAWCGHGGRPARAVVVSGGTGLVFRDVGGKPYVVDLLAPDLATAGEPATRVNSSSLHCPDTGCASRVKSARWH